MIPRKALITNTLWFTLMLTHLGIFGQNNQEIHDVSCLQPNMTNIKK